MNKVIENFRDHPSLKQDSIQLVFKIEQETYLIREGIVRQIIPKRIEHTNIGEPYANLIRLDFVFADDVDAEYDDCIDFAPEHEKDLLEGNGSASLVVSV